MEKLFDISSKDDKLIGHLKLFSKSLKGAKVRANLTGLKKNLTIFFDEWNSDREFEFWINAISFFVDEMQLGIGLREIVEKLVKFHKAELKEYSSSVVLDPVKHLNEH